MGACDVISRFKLVLNVCAKSFNIFSYEARKRGLIFTQKSNKSYLSKPVLT